MTIVTFGIWVVKLEAVVESLSLSFYVGGPTFSSFKILLAMFTQFRVRSKIHEFCVDEVVQEDTLGDLQTILVRSEDAHDVKRTFRIQNE